MVWGMDGERWSNMVWNMVTQQLDEGLDQERGREALLPYTVNRGHHWSNNKKPEIKSH